MMIDDMGVDCQIHKDKYQIGSHCRTTVLSLGLIMPDHSHPRTLDRYLTRRNSDLLGFNGNVAGHFV